MSSNVGKRVVPIIMLLTAHLPVAASAQMHAHGSTWIHRSHTGDTMLHARGDSLCLLQFPSGCWGGMMSPDSIFCRFWTSPPESLPQGCFFGYHCSIENPAGRSMMSGRMMPADFFRRQLDATLHYDPEVVRAAGLDANDLVLVTLHEGTYELVAEAVHDPARAVFQFSTSRPASWYGVVNRSSLPLAVNNASWSAVKGAYR